MTAARTVLPQAALDLPAHLAERGQEILVEALRNDSAKIRALQEVLSDPHRYVRQSAARSPGRICDASSVPALVAALEDEHWLVRRSAHGALQSITGQSFGAADAALWREWLRKQQP